MKTQVQPASENESRSVTNEVSQLKQGDEFEPEFEDHRPEALAQRQLKTLMDSSNRNAESTQLKDILGNHSDQQALPIQQKPAPKPVQRENNTGLSDNLKSGIENLSGYAMDDVKVHYNSAKPAQLQAHAYAQGTDIHLASGQEKHLPHEAWHVVQQKQGRVKPTLQMKTGVNVNDNVGLENEADVMGAKAATQRAPDPSNAIQKKPVESTGEPTSENFGPTTIAQRKLRGMVNDSSQIQHTTQRRPMGPQVIQRVDAVLGMGARAAIIAGMNANSPYIENNYLRGIALQLTVAGLSPGDTQNLMTAMGTAITYQGKYTRCATAGINMATGNVPFGLIRQLILDIVVDMPTAQHAHLTSLAIDLRTWTYGHIDAVRTGPNPNAFSLTELGNIARRVPADESANALHYIGLVGWAVDAIEHIAIGRAAGNPSNLSVTEWLAIALNLAVDDHATTIAIAQIPGWNAGNLANLATGFAGAGGAVLGHWTQAAAVLPNLEAETAAVAALAGRDIVVHAITNGRLTGPQLTGLLAHPQLGIHENIAHCFQQQALTSGAHLITLLTAIGAGTLQGPQLLDLLRHNSHPNSLQLTQLIGSPKLTNGAQLLELLNHNGLANPAELINMLATGVHSGNQILDLLNSPYYSSGARQWNGILDYLQNYWGSIQNSAHGGGGGFAARNSNAHFLTDHLANDRDGAIAATRNRASNGRGMQNTVLMHSDQDMKDKVLAANDNDRYQLHGPVWGVYVTANYRIIESMHGDGIVVITDVGDVATGDVILKVFFDYATRRFSISGVEGQG